MKSTGLGGFNKIFTAFMTVFFVCVFPVFFTPFSNDFFSRNNTPTSATIALGVGIILWLIFLFLLHRSLIKKAASAAKEFRKTIETGQMERGYITHKYSRGTNGKGKEDIEITVEFRNFVGTTVTRNFQFTDSKPHERRHEIGNSIDLVLSRDRSKPTVVIANAKAVTTPLFSWLIIAFF
ncbi:MAG: hypothetical protein Q4C71_03235, partial [Microbacteriaceae bacterium]|nr:hypothetical protein [Microbacteriaceae bacterium]